MPQFDPDYFGGGHACVMFDHAEYPGSSWTRYKDTDGYAFHYCKRPAKTEILAGRAHTFPPGTTAVATVGATWRTRRDRLARQHPDAARAKAKKTIAASAALACKSLGVEVT